MICFMTVGLILPLLLPPDVSLGDLSRFPSRQAALEARTFNSGFRQYLEARQVLMLHDWWTYQRAIEECQGLWRLFDDLADAQDIRWNDNCRLQALRRVRNGLGEQAYWAGQMPTCVPVWICRAID